MSDLDKNAEPAWFGPMKLFFETKPASQKALKHLKDGVEISLVIDKTEECALYRRGSSVCVERRPARKPDVAFWMTAAATERLCATDGADVGHLGVSVLREFKKGEVKIKVPGSLLSITLNGYLGIVKEGGVEFAKFLAQNGVATLSKIPGIIKSLREG
jgi:hypothetical protein